MLLYIKFLAPGARAIRSDEAGEALALPVLKFTDGEIAK